MPERDTELLIRAENIGRIYRSGEVEVSALKSVTVGFGSGEFTAIAGPSGSGKTTLLNIISGLDLPTSGRVLLAGKAITELTGGELSDFRRDHIGFIFQSYNLVPVLKVAENVEYVMMLQGVRAAERRERVEAILHEVGLEGMEDRLPGQLSGGQQQRVAVARAMVSDPDLILADEPTANIDSATGAGLLDMMRDLNEHRGMTFIFSTHDEMIMERARRLVTLRDGEVDGDEVRG